MSDAEMITAEQAIAAIHRTAFSGDDGQPRVHCFIGTMGANWSVESAIDCVNCAYVHEGVPQIAWNDTMFGRCLVVIEADPPGKGGRLRTFDSVTPDNEVT